MLQRVFAFFVFILLLPELAFLYILHIFFSPGPFLFMQKRVGKNKKIFTIYKIRSMVVAAEKRQKSLHHLNEADGPVFKMKHDPRFTSFGRFLSHTGLDELPQIVNIIKGEMAFIGPRPLPVGETTNISQKYQARFSVLPGITSSWVIKGAHTLSFHKWMELDLFYVRHRSFWLDIEIALQTILLMIKMIRRYFREQGRVLLSTK